MMIQKILNSKASSRQNLYGLLKMVWPRHPWGRQEDSHEFLMKCLDQLTMACFPKGCPMKEATLNQDKTPIFKIFGSTLRSQVQCLRCKYKSNTQEQNYTLSLDFPHKVVKEGRRMYI
mmetsp:Transcript_26699/g.25735  ORF Transcript_26699/g.25735 Transcript_26699/m.25735 type:complete len:118 (-) Transcript_26699:1015-1368(-)